MNEQHSTGSADPKVCPICLGTDAAFYCGECGRSGLDAPERCKNCGEAITHWMGCEACGKELQ